MANPQGDITFNKSMSIAQFLDEQGASTIEVVKNPNSGKLFFNTDTGIQGKVTNKINELENNELQVAYCYSDDDGEFYMLCKRTTNNVVRTITV